MSTHGNILSEHLKTNLELCVKEIFV